MIDHSYILEFIKTQSMDLSSEYMRENKMYSLIKVYLKTLERSSHLKNE